MAALNKINFNKEIVQMRHAVKRAKLCTINKIVRESRKLKNSNGTEEQKNKRRRKYERLIEEVQAIKGMSDDEVSKFLLTNKKDPNSILTNAESSTRMKAFAKLCMDNLLKAALYKFKQRYPNWSDEIPILLSQWGKRVKKEGEMSKDENISTKFSTETHKSDRNEIKKSEKTNGEFINKKSEKAEDESMFVTAFGNNIFSVKTITNKDDDEEIEKVKKQPKKNKKMKYSHEDKSTENLVLEEEEQTSALDVNIERKVKNKERKRRKLNNHNNNNNSSLEENFVLKEEEQTSPLDVNIERKVKNKERKRKKLNNHNNNNNSSLEENFVLKEEEQTSPLDVNIERKEENKERKRRKLNNHNNNNNSSLEENFVLKEEEQTSPLDVNIERKEENKDRKKRKLNDDSIEENFVIKNELETIPIIVNKNEKKQKPKETKIADPFFVTADNSEYMTVVTNERQIEALTNNRNEQPTGFRIKEDSTYFNRFGNDNNRNRSNFFRPNNDSFRNNKHENDNNRNRSNFFRPNNDSFRNNKHENARSKRQFLRQGNNINVNNSNEEKLHPSWEAKKKQSNLSLTQFAGKKIVFNND